MFGGRPKRVKHWRQREPRCRNSQKLSALSTLFVHYSASDGEGIDKKGEPKAAMRNIQSHHMDTNRWCDIGYSYVLFQVRGIFRRPLLFEARGFHAIPASQLGHNTGNVSVCVIADSNDRIKRSTYRALAWIVRRCPARNVRGHKDVTATSCPGPYLYSKVPHLKKAAKRSKKRLLP